MTAVRLAMAPRRAGLAPEAFQRHWADDHADAAGAIPGLRRYVQHHAILRDGRPVLPYPGFDACAELEFDTVDAHDAGFASPHYRGAVRADEDRFVDKTTFAWALCEPITLLEPGALAVPVTLLWLWRAHPTANSETVAAALDAWASAVATDPVVRGHRRLRVRSDWHRGRPPPSCEAADVLTFDGSDAALGHLARVAQDAARLLCGAVFGAAAHLARPRRIV